MKAVDEGFVVRRDPDRRGIVFAMPKDLAVDLQQVDPRFGTIADLMEHEAELFDFLEAGDRLAAAMLSEEPPVERPEFRAVPVVAGGQGRSDEEVRADARALCVAGLAAMVLGLSYGTVALVLGWFPFETIR